MIYGMTWFTEIYTDSESVAHIVLLYAASVFGLTIYCRSYIDKRLKDK